MSGLFSALAAVSVAFASSALVADRATPKADLKGSADSPLIGRHQGSIVVSYEHKQYDEFAVPLTALERVPDKRDNHNNRYFEPKQKATVAGAHWRIV